jgi:hypothetical protein
MLIFNSLNKLIFRFFARTQPFLQSLFSFRLGYVWIGGIGWNGMEWDGIIYHSIVWI